MGTDFARIPAELVQSQHTLPGEFLGEFISEEHKMFVFPLLCLVFFLSFFLHF